MRFSALLLLVGSMAQAYMDHDKIMDGFKHVQVAPQMGRPVPYEKASKIFPGKRKKHGKHKKDSKPGKREQKLGRKQSPASPAPVPPPSATPKKASSPSPTPMPSPSVSGSPIISDSYVDLRSKDSFIKSQPDPLCTAYAGAAAIENLIGPGAPDLSERYIFSLYNEYNVDMFAEHVPGKPLALATEWPRDGNKKSNLTITNHKLISMKWIGDGDIIGAKAALKRGHPVYLGLEVPQDMAACRASIRPSSGITSGGHAVEVPGFRDDNSDPKLGGGYLIIKNSWSEGCGDKGYQYMPYSLCDKMYCYFYEAEAAQ